MKISRNWVACLAGTMLLVVLGALVSFGSFVRVEAAGVQRENSYVVLARAGDLMSSLKDAETGYRGYLLTRDEAFLQPYFRVQEGLRGRLAGLRELASGEASRDNLLALIPVMDATLAEMAQGIVLRRSQGPAGPVLDPGVARVKGRMDAIRARMDGFVQAERELLALRRAAFTTGLARLLWVLCATTLLTLLLAGVLSYTFYRESQDRVHQETRRLLEAQQAISARLQAAVATLEASEEKLTVTLNSIGDAVLTTDAEGRLLSLNPIAEQLTGWTQAEALGRLADEVFQLINQETRLPSVIPIQETLSRGTIHGLANHTILIARDGSECAIADSCAPIRHHGDKVVGAVMVFRDVSREYAAQKARAESSALIQMVLNTVADGIITLNAGGGTVETANPAAERMFGYPPGELPGMAFSLLIPDLERAPWSGSLEHYSASDERHAIGRRHEVVGRRKDASRFSLEMVVSEMWLGSQRHFAGVFSDITVRKAVEDRLRWTEESFRLMVDSVVDYAIVMLDPAGRVVSWNAGAQRLKGYREEEIIGQHCSRFYSAEDVEAGKPQQDLDAVTAKGRFEAEGWRARKNGSTFWANEVFTAIRDRDGNLRGFANLTQDLSERRKVEAELTNARTMAEKANLAKSHFLSSMSHELRSPLNGILGFAQLMESEVPPPTGNQKESLAQILKAGWHLLTLINEILDLAKVESGQVPMSREPVGVADILQECLGMVETQARQRGIILRCPDPDQRTFVLADRTRIKQVLLNLLSNAIKYNVDHGTVEVVCREADRGRVRISVRDTGQGLAPYQVEQLFQPFNRLGQEAGGEEGTGIGLVVAKRLVELMEGVIGVESIVGGGSLFWFDLPAVAAPDLALAADPAEDPAAAAGPRGIRVHQVLYVEDNPANLKLVELIIARRPDIHLLTAVDGRSGIALARRARLDVILMDINLPGMNGFEVLKILRGIPALAPVPVIAISANAMPVDVANGLKAGFFRYLTKPIDVNEFMTVLELALESPEAALNPTL